MPDHIGTDNENNGNDDNENDDDDDDGDGDRGMMVIMIKTTGTHQYCHLHDFLPVLVNSAETSVSKRSETHHK